MEVTVAEYGRYKISFDGPTMKRKRALNAMATGELMNVYFSPPSKSWFSETLVVHVPLRRGILNYRLLLINSIYAEDFSKIKALDDLKQFSVGTQDSWSTTEILVENNFRIQKGHNFDGLFHMLEQNRFDFFPRGVHEIYVELCIRESEISNIIVAPDIALFTPFPTFICVSKAMPELHKRLSAGMLILQDSGELKTIFNRFYLDEIKEAKIHERRIINIPTSIFTHDDMQSEPDWWFNPQSGEYR